MVQVLEYEDVGLALSGPWFAPGVDNPPPPGRSEEYQNLFGPPRNSLEYSPQGYGFYAPGPNNDITPPRVRQFDLQNFVVRTEGFGTNQFAWSVTNTNNFATSLRGFTLAFAHDELGRTFPYELFDNINAFFDAGATFAKTLTLPPDQKVFRVFHYGRLNSNAVEFDRGYNPFPRDVTKGYWEVRDDRYITDGHTLRLRDGTRSVTVNSFPVRGGSGIYSVTQVKPPSPQQFTQLDFFLTGGGAFGPTSGRILDDSDTGYTFVRDYVAPPNVDVLVASIAGTQIGVYRPALEEVEVVSTRTAVSRTRTHFTYGRS